MYINTPLCTHGAVQVVSYTNQTNMYTTGLLSGTSEIMGPKDMVFFVFKG